MAAIAPRFAGSPWRAGREPGSLRGVSQLRSERGVGVVTAGVVSTVEAGAADVSVVVVVVDVSVGAVLFSVADGSLVVVVVLLGIALVSAGVDWVVVVVVVSVDCATAAPRPASMAATAATADNFF